MQFPRFDVLSMLYGQTLLRRSATRVGHSE
jgi:hypothetical protein